MENEVSKWQFIAEYYGFLLEMYKNIREAYIYEQYEIAYKDCEQIFYHIWRDVEKMKEGKEKVDKIKKMIEEIYIIKNEYMLSTMPSDIPEQYQIEDATKLKTILRLKVSDLFKELTGTISDLNMFMPKQRIDNRLDIYKQ